MTVIFCIALLLVCLTDTTATGTSAVIVMYIGRVITILGLGLLALLSTGWLP